MDATRCPIHPRPSDTMHIERPRIGKGGRVACSPTADRHACNCFDDNTVVLTDLLARPCCRLAPSHHITLVAGTAASPYLSFIR